MRHNDNFPQDADCSDHMQDICLCSRDIEERLLTYVSFMDTPFIKDFPSRQCPPSGTTAIVHTSLPTVTERTIRPESAKPGEVCRNSNDQVAENSDNNSKQPTIVCAKYNETVYTTFKTIYNHFVSYCPTFSEVLKEGGWTLVVFIGVVYLVCLFGSLYFAIYYMRSVLN